MEPCAVESQLAAPRASPVVAVLEPAWGWAGDFGPFLDHTRRAHLCVAEPDLL